MPTYSFKMTAETVEAIRSNSTDATELIAQDLLAGRGKEVLKAMDHFCQEDRGTPAGGSLRIDPDAIGISEDGSGTMMIEFQEEEYRGCRDMNILADREIDIDFSVSFENQSLSITVPECSRRSYRPNDSEEA